MSAEQTNLPTGQETARTLLQPDQIRALEVRADQAHPDEPVATGREVLDLIYTLRETDAHAISHTLQADRVCELGREWSGHRDPSIAAAGRILLAVYEGRRGALADLPT
jgi:hypothetical protein